MSCTFIVFRRTDGMAAMLVRFRNLFGWLTGVFRSRADLILIGESGVATAIAGLACPTAASLAWLPRSAVLGSAATTVVRLAETLGRGDTRDGCPLASQRLSMVLGLALAGSAPSRPHSGEPKSRPPQSYWQRPQAPPSVCSFP